jgi:hypothetical protein
MENKTFALTYPWDKNGYKPDVTYELGVDDMGFHMYIKAKERNPRRVETEHQKMICEDSCVEWFANFMPEACDRYFNFEMNANGATYAAFRKDRYEYQMLTEEDIKEMQIRTEIREEDWIVQYRVPFSLIRKYIPQYQFREGMKISTNFYKCGDKTSMPHYGIWKEFPIEAPDFHLPQFFGEVILE